MTMYWFRGKMCLLEKQVNNNSTILEFSLISNCINYIFIHHIWVIFRGVHELSWRAFSNLSSFSKVRNSQPSYIETKPIQLTLVGLGQRSDLIVSCPYKKTSL